MLSFKQFLEESKRNEYEGVFNWHGEVLKLRTEAVSERKARMNLFKQLSKKVGVNIQSISMYFKERGNAVNINLVR